MYYTGAGSSADAITIMMLENGIKGKQSNYGSPLYNLANYDADGVTYNHNHVLRKTLTATYGTPITSFTSGSSFTTSVTYTIPATYGSTGFTSQSTLVPPFPPCSFPGCSSRTKRSRVIW